MSSIILCTAVPIPGVYGSYTGGSQDERNIAAAAGLQHNATTGTTSAKLQERSCCSSSNIIVKQQQQQKRQQHQQQQQPQHLQHNTERKLWRRVTTFPFTLSLQIQTSQASKGLIFNFRIRRTLRASSQVVVGLANRDCPTICASRPGTAYISAAWRIGSDLTAGHPFPVVLTERFPVPSTSLSNPCDGHPARSFICGRQSCGTTS